MSMNVGGSNNGYWNYSVNTRNNANSQKKDNDTIYHELGHFKNSNNDTIYHELGHLKNNNNKT